MKSQHLKASGVDFDAILDVALTVVVIFGAFAVAILA